MTVKWIAAGGAYQVPFMIAAGHALKGTNSPCPKCAAPSLRYYFHVFNIAEERGSIWVWCNTCRTHSHLPRVRAEGIHQSDPFAELDLEEFAELELDPNLGFLDRLNGLWDKGELK